jgi:hypothetical protein
MIILNLRFVIVAIICYALGSILYCFAFGIELSFIDLVKTSVHQLFFVLGMHLITTNFFKDTDDGHESN